MFSSRVTISFSSELASQKAVPILGTLIRVTLGNLIRVRKSTFDLYFHMGIHGLFRGHILPGVEWALGRLRSPCLWEVSISVSVTELMVPMTTCQNEVHNPMFSRATPSSFPSVWNRCCGWPKTGWQARLSSLWIIKSGTLILLTKGTSSVSKISGELCHE